MNKVRFLIFLLILGVAMACNKDDENGGSTDFNRQEMLINYADNLILPAFNDLSVKIGALESASQTFISQRNLNNLISLQTAWRAAYQSFQYANAYNLGPAAEQGLNKAMIEEIGTFPVSEAKINANIASNNTNFNDFNRDNRGFLAIEYLIFSLGNDQNEVLQCFEDNVNTGTYLTALIAHLKNYVAPINAAWSGSYRNTFVNNTGTSVGSSTSQFYNEFVKSFEAIKNFKVGLPVGKRPGQIEPEPTRVEAYYSGLSVEMIKINLQAVEDIWYGKSVAGVDGVGFKEYLESVTGGPALVAATEEQMQKVKAALNALPNTRLSEQVISNTAQVDALYTELQKHTRFYKSDMSSLLGIAITFSSGDGD
jgi:predicted lipoprotein